MFATPAGPVESHESQEPSSEEQAAMATATVETSDQHSVDRRFLAETIVRDLVRSSGR